MKFSNNTRSKDPSAEDAYASPDMYGAMTKRRFPSQQCNPQEIIAEVRDEFMLDANSRQNISTLCQRWLEDEVHRLMSLCVDKNIEDKDKYPGRTLRIHGGR